MDQEKLSIEGPLRDSKGVDAEPLTQVYLLHGTQTLEEMYTRWSMRRRPHCSVISSSQCNAISRLGSAQVRNEALASVLVVCSSRPCCYSLSLGIPCSRGEGRRSFDPRLVLAER